MEKINKTTLIGLIVLALILGISITAWLMGGKEPVSNVTSPSTTGTVESTQAVKDLEVAPTYEEKSGEPFIQISQETMGRSEKTQPQGEGVSEGSSQLPSGFGLSGDSESETASSGSLKEMPVELETPVEAAVGATTVPPSPNNGSIEAIDPREVGVTANDGPDQNFEETVLTVQRTLTAVNPEGEKQLIRLKIPVMYKSRTLRLEGETKEKGLELLKKLRTKASELASIKEDLEKTLIDWNELVKRSTPYESLLPESPTLPQNQSAGNLNRENDPSMSAGKSISYEIINNTKK
jgi:hypothetical protein